jgi:hypothetical protein
MQNEIFQNSVTLSRSMLESRRNKDGRALEDPVECVREVRWARGDLRERREQCCPMLRVRFDDRKDDHCLKETRKQTAGLD